MVAFKEDIRFEEVGSTSVLFVMLKKICVRYFRKIYAGHVIKISKEERAHIQYIFFERHLNFLLI